MAGVQSPGCVAYAFSGESPIIQPMRVLITADLHYDSDRSRPGAEALAEEVCRTGGDALVLVGDAASAEHQPLRECLRLFQDFPGKKYFVLGNHCLWCLPGEDSIDRYERIVPAIAAEMGFAVVVEADIDGELWLYPNKNMFGFHPDNNYTVMTPDEIVGEMKSGHLYFGIALDEMIVGVYKARIRGDMCFGEHQSIHPSCRAAGLAEAMYDQFFELAKRTNCRKNVVNILIGHGIGELCVRRYSFQKVGEPFEQAEGMLVQRYERQI